MSAETLVRKVDELRAESDRYEGYLRDMRLGRGAELARKHDQHEEARLALESGVAAVEKIIRDRDVESHIAQLRRDRLLGLLGRVEQAREFLKSTLAESDADEAEGGAGWDVEVDARTVLSLLDAATPECPQPCEHLSAEDAREGRTCPDHPCTCVSRR